MNTQNALTKLQRLEGYLLQDPNNEQLIAAAFDEALQSGAGGSAEAHLRRAQTMGLEPTAWRRREARWHLCGKRWHEASAVLSDLVQRDAGAAHDANVLHDLAYIDLRNGKFEAGATRLAPLVAAGLVDVAENAALQLLWVRLMHRLGHFDDAMQWASAANAAMQLSIEAKGAMSLLALDASHYDESLRWSKAALRGSPQQLEASVARASLALAEPDPAEARRLLQAALDAHPEDGRVWSTLGFAELMDHRLEAARAAFERAVVLLGMHIGTWHGLAWTALSQHDIERAAEAFHGALQIDRNVADTHGGIAVIAALRGDAAASQAAIQRAFGLDAECLTARYAQALLKGDARDPASLQRFVERAFVGRKGPLGNDVLGLLRMARAPQSRD